MWPTQQNHYYGALATLCRGRRVQVRLRLSPRSLAHHSRRSSSTRPPSSRVCDISSFDAPDVAPSKAFFRWSRPVRQVLGPKAHEPVKIKTLIVALPGAAQQFVQQLTASWSPVGSLVTSDQAIHPCKLQNDTNSTGVILSKTGVKVSEENNTLALLVGQEVLVAGAWIWLKTLMQHVDAEDIICLDSQLSTIYAADEEIGAKLRMLASSSVTDEMKMTTPVRALEVPQFVTGIPAALLTHGELHKRHVRVFVSVRDVSTTPIDVVRSFLPLAATSSSVLGALERPMFFKPSGESQSAGSLNVLYT
ncbi:hypothetical protein F442_02845 [Phytophthora nicotianae P10297]|uniref:Proteasome assembly chaperone 1 n=1 Tax=Phytophthora nicotianae P10297 TaxID=1317064 RepID=W2ZYK5_PHYNI|nr:hypothetical protein F442_02845 [Phytophthora nicotianae P10297]